MIKPEACFGYLNGLTQMASAVSVNCGPSEIRVDCFSVKSFPALFCKAYRLPQKLLTLRESGQSLAQLLENWLGNEPKNVTDALCHYLHASLGDAIQCFEAENIERLCDALSAPGGHGPFYTTEDLFFAVFRDVAVCFMLGNYE